LYSDGTDASFKVHINGEEAGISLRLDHRGDSGYFIALCPAEQKICFAKLTSDGEEETIQARVLPRIELGRFDEIKVLAKWEFFEIYLDDDLAITKSDYDYSGGYVGLFAKRGGDFKEIEWDHLCLGKEHFWGKPT